ncbi:DUF2490 domain-containing protein [Maribacter sp.]|uniref:DUF2490 domain-containing protein n=1 Tax=Maribacter sp. TaxID=1897614 RepID=UPI0025C2024B|nr:DUF2490 domain-containing protein [Maribacter sp.]
MRKLSLLLILIFLGQSDSGIAQSDLQSWTSIKLSSKINDEVSYAIRPIIRHRNDLSEYDNSSIDISIAFNLGKGFSMAILERYWWLQNGVNRNFWFFDIKHKANLSNNIGMSNVIRWHIAQDIEIDDPNFMRWHPTFTFKTQGRFTPYIGTELFFRLDGVNELQRTRHLIGSNIKITNDWSFNLTLWKQDRANLDSQFTQWIIVTTAAYNM